MARINKTQFAILGCLSIAPMSAYDVKTFMTRSTNYFWMEYEAQLYPTLKKLYQAGYVECQKIDAQKGGTRGLYSITEKGLQFLQQWIVKKTEQSQYRNEFILKLFFGNQVDKKISIKHIEHYREEAAEQLTYFQKIENEINANKKIKRKPFILATIRYGIYITQAEIAWCNETIHSLKN